MHLRKNDIFTISRELSYREAKDKKEYYFHFRNKLQCHLLLYCIFYFKSKVILAIVSIDGCSQGKNVKTVTSNI